MSRFSLGRRAILRTNGASWRNAQICNQHKPSIATSISKTIWKSYYSCTASHMCQKFCQQNVLPVMSLSLRFKSATSLEYTNEEQTSKDTILASSSKGKTNENQSRLKLGEIFLTMRNEANRKGRVFSYDFEKAIQYLENSDGCSSQQALAMIKFCGNTMPDEKQLLRTEKVMKLWKLLEEKRVPLDASHYNALLQVHIDNDHNVSPTEFLSWMEEKGIGPNRVTYQNLIAKYCQNGDIAGATKILEHMKEQNLPLNEQVFLSFIDGHCRAKDFEGAKGVMNIMNESGLEIGKDAYLALLLGWIRGGKPFNDVNREMDSIRDRGIIFNDGDLFEIIVALIKADQEKAANEVASLLPKKQGYFQTLRNYIPRIIFAGHVSLACQLYTSYSTVLRSSEQNFPERTNEGLFLLKAMVKSEAPHKNIIEFLQTIQDQETKLNKIRRVLETCVKYDLIDYGQDLFKKLENEIESTTIRVSEQFVQDEILHFHDNEGVVNFAQRVCQIGLTFNTFSLFPLLDKLLSEDLNPNVMNALDPLISKKKLREHIGKSVICNSVVQVLLNRLAIRRNPSKVSESSNFNFLRTAAFFLNVDFRSVRGFWHNSLARAYLSTKDMDSFISILWACLHLRCQKNEEKEKILSSLEHLHSISHHYDPNIDPDNVLETILISMKNCKIGVTEDFVAKIKPRIRKESLKELLNELSSKELEKHWTRESVNSFREERNKLTWQQMGELLPKLLPKEFRDSDKIKTLGNNRQSIASSGQLVRNANIGNAILKYLEEGKVDEAIGIIKENYGKKGFVIPWKTVRDIVESLIDRNEVEKAQKFISSMFKNEIPVFAPIVLMLWNAMPHQEVIEWIPEVSRHMILGEFRNISQRYSDNKSRDQVLEIIDKLKELNHLSEEDTFKERLELTDIEESVQAFEKMAREKRKVTGRLKLINRLIAEEDMERMQRVLNASVEVIGEESSLYDLSLSFLILGKTNQARKLLETPGLRYKEKEVQFICSTLIRSGNLEALEKFTIFSRSIFGCKRDFIYRQLVKANSHNPNKVQDIWEMIQEESFAPSVDLLREIGGTLKSSGKEIPFVIPEGQTGASERQLQRKEK